MLNMKYFTIISVMCDCVTVSVNLLAVFSLYIEIVLKPWYRMTLFNIDMSGFLCA